MALLDCTKNPRQLKLVEPQTTIFAFGPSTTMVLLCWSWPMCCRLTFRRPPRRQALRRLGLRRAVLAVVPASSMMICSRAPSFSSRDTTSGSLRS